MQTTIDGISFSYDDFGHGPAVVLIHGFPLGRRMWRPQIKPLTEAGFRVIVPDLRGFGGSSAPAGPYSMSVFADDIVGLLDRLGLEKATIGGMSMGGYILFNLLERYPGRVEAAIFIVTRAGADDDEGKARRTKLAHAVSEQGPRTVTDFFAELVFAEETLRHRPELVREAGEWMRAAQPRGLEGGLLAIRDRKDFTPDLPLLDLPALVVGAEKDRAISIEESRAIARGLPRATFCAIAGAGHMVNLEQPDEFNKCLIDFLRSLPQA